jgi:hypothetical protein
LPLNFLSSLSFLYFFLLRLSFSLPTVTLLILSSLISLARLIKIMQHIGRCSNYNRASTFPFSYWSFFLRNLRMKKLIFRFSSDWNVRREREKSFERNHFPWHRCAIFIFIVIVVAAFPWPNSFPIVYLGNFLATFLAWMMRKFWVSR